MIALIAVVGTLAGCSVAPTFGPARDALIDAGSRSDGPFTLVELTNSVVDTLARWRGPSLAGRFKDYRPPAAQVIGIGDSVKAVVFEAASGGLFSSSAGQLGSAGSRTATFPPQVVPRDGAITIPYAGRVSVAGRTPDQVEQAVVARLAGKAIQPQAIVTVSRNLSNSVTVNGEAIAGGRIPLSGHGDRILDVIAAAGGVTAPANQIFIDLTRDGVLARAPMQALLADPRENIYARPGDDLTVWRYPVTFTALGATLQNAVVPFDAIGISLQEAIAKSGGLIDSRADPEGVFVIRFEWAALVRKYPGTSAHPAGRFAPVAYHINMRDPASLLIARRFRMRDKDILFVSNSPVADLAKILGVVNLASSPIYSGVYLGKTLTNSTTAATTLPLPFNPAAPAAPTSSGSSAGAGSSSNAPPSNNPAPPSK